MFVVMLAFGLGAFSASGQDESVSEGNLLVVPPAEARPVEGEAASAPEPVPEEPSHDTPAVEHSGPVPPAFPISRYQPMWEKSPFQLKSEAPAEMSEGLAQRYALTGIAEIDGEPIVFLMERSTQNRVMVRREGGEIKLVEVNIEAKYSDSSAVIRRSGEVGVVKFDSTAPGAAMAMVPPAVPGTQGRSRRVAAPEQAAVAQQIPAPGMPATMPGQMPGMPTLPNPSIVPTAPQVPTTPDGTQIVVPGQNPEAPPPRVIRRRAIIPAAP
jgi:hypothetical protein